MLRIVVLSCPGRIEPLRRETLGSILPGEDKTTILLMKTMRATGCISGQASSGFRDTFLKLLPLTLKAMREGGVIIELQKMKTGFGDDRVVRLSRGTCALHVRTTRESEATRGT